MCASFFKTIISAITINKSITALFPTITRDKLPGEDGADEIQYDLQYEDADYIAKFRRISLKGMAEHSDMIDSEGYDGYLIAVYLFDETALHIALQEVDDQLKKLRQNQPARQQTVASGAVNVAPLTVGNKGKIVEVNSKLMFAVVEFDEDAMKASARVARSPEL